MAPAKVAATQISFLRRTAFIKLPLIFKSQEIMRLL